MLLTRFDPFREFANIQRVFDGVQKSNDEMSISAFVPKVNTREKEDAYCIDIDLPGIRKEDIDIDIYDGKMTIKGERNFKQEIKEEDYYKIESSFGKFQRTFAVPDNVDLENVNATYDNGVLEVIIPKIDKDTNRKKIEIK